MPPRRSASSASKRKADSSSPSPPSAASKPTTKRAKKPSAGGLPDSPSAPTGKDSLAPSDFPKNTEMPEKLDFARPSDPNSVRISAWNITSLKSSEPKGLLRYIDAEDADILVLSETKVNETPMHPKLTARYPHQYWGIGQTKGYAGVAVLTKIKPEKVTYGLPTLKDADSKGRMLTLEFENTILIGTYAVNAGEGLKTMPNKIAWNQVFAEFVNESDQRKPVIWCGDLNVVQDERDLSQASKKWNKSPGYTQIECDAHRSLLQGTATPDAKPLVDVWRAMHPDAVGHYSFHGWRGMCRSKGIGWRLDSFILSERIKDRAKECEIRHECYGASDHVPIYCDIAGPL